MHAVLQVLIVPDKFKGTLTAQQAGEAIAASWRAAQPQPAVHTWHAGGTQPIPTSWPKFRAYAIVPGITTLDDALAHAAPSLTRLQIAAKI